MITLVYKKGSIFLFSRAFRWWSRPPEGALLASGTIEATEIAVQRVRTRPTPTDDKVALQPRLAGPLGAVHADLRAFQEHAPGAGG